MACTLRGFREKYQQRGTEQRWLCTGSFFKAELYGLRFGLGVGVVFVLEFDCGGRVLSRLRALNKIGVGVLNDGYEFDSVRMVHKHLTQ